MRPEIEEMLNSLSPDELGELCEVAQAKLAEQPPTNEAPAESPVDEPSAVAPDEEVPFERPGVGRY